MGQSLFDLKLSKFLHDITSKNKNKKFIIAADWNINFLNANINPKIDQFLNNMLSFGLLPTITVPTRITERSATLLDNFFISYMSENNLTRAIYDDISDHLPILINLSYKKPTKLKTMEDVPNSHIFSQANYIKFQAAINSENGTIAVDQYNLFVVKRGLQFILSTIS